MATREILTAAMALTLLAACSSGGDDGAENLADGAPAPTSARPTTPTPSEPSTGASAPEPQIEEFELPAGSRPHDVWVADDGTVWYTAQGSGELGRLDPATGEVVEIPLGDGSRPHGVVVGPDGAPWVTDGGLNAIVRVDPDTSEVEVFPLPDSHPDANLNTATFDGNGVLWFTGQAGMYGRVDPDGEVVAYDAPGGTGPYGITTTPDGAVYYASLAGDHIARIDTTTGEATRIEPPTTEQGSRRVWSDSAGRVWSSQWHAGQVAVYDPSTDDWTEWRLPGERPQAYAVYVDEADRVWLSDFGANALVRFDPGTQEFRSFPLPSNPGEVRQLHGRAGEVWAPESAADALVVVRG